MVAPHFEYLRLRETEEARHVSYRDLFKQHIPEQNINDIRGATNKSWVLGNDRFKQRIQDQLNRLVESKARGGDRKSERYKTNHLTVRSLEN